MAMNQKLTVSEIAAIISAECRGIEVPFNAQQTAKLDLETASATVINRRINTCATIAKLAHEQDWDGEYLDDAVKLAQAQPGSNDAKTKKAVEVFCSQVKACARPRVRGQFPVIRQAIADAWAIEKNAMDQAKKGDAVDTPLRKFVSREYEMVLRACREIHEGKTGLVITCADDVVNWARANDPDKDAERIAKRLKALAATLHEFYQEFPHAQIDAAKQAIASIAAIELKAVYDAKRAAEAARVAAIPLAPIPPVVQARVAPLVSPSPDHRVDGQGVEPAEGVFDTDELMNDTPTPTPPQGGVPNLDLVAQIEALAA